MTDSERPPPKVEVARALMVQGSVFVYLDPRAPGVIVPRHLARQPQLVLQVGLDLVVPIPDLRVDEDGLSGTLSFNRAPFHCRIPWSAVYTLHDDEGMGMVWREDMPEEIAAEVRAGAERAQAKPKRPHLRAVGGRGDEPAPERAEATTAAREAPSSPVEEAREEPVRRTARVNHLRLIK